MKALKYYTYSKTKNKIVEPQLEREQSDGFQRLEKKIINMEEKQQKSK